MFVSLHHAVVLQEAAYIPWGAGDGLRALCRAEGLRVVAVGDGSVSVAGDGLRIAVVRGGDGQRGGSEDTVSDDGGSGSGTLSNIGILIARDSGATLIVDTCHRAVEHASADGEAAAYRTCHEASQGCIFVALGTEVGGKCHAADATGDGCVAKADAHEARQQFAVLIARAADNACRVQVFDGGTFYALERSAEAALVSQVDGQCVSVAVKRAAEWFVVVIVGCIATASRPCPADVVG